MPNQLYNTVNPCRSFLQAFLFIGAWLCTSLTATSQTIPYSSFFTIKGAIADSTSLEPLEAATVSLHVNRQSTAFKTVSSSDEGLFEAASLPFRQYALTITHTGYISKTISLPPFTTTTVDLGTLLLTPVTNKLAEIRVLAKKTLIRHEADKLIYDVEADPDRMTFNTMDMLRKVPGIVIDAEDNVELNGSGLFQVLLNGHRSSLFVRNVEEIFKSLPATSVKRIEIITSPSARFDSEGSSGIINIITQSKIIRGYTVSLRSGYASPGGPTTGGNLTARVGRLGLSGMWGYNDNQSPVSTNNSFRTDKRNKIELLQTGESRSRYQNLYGNTELTWQFTEASLLSAHYNRRQGNGRNTYLQEVEMTGTGGTLLQAYQNNSRGTSSTLSEDYGLDLQLGDKKKKDRLLTLSAKEIRDRNSFGNHNSLAPKVNTIMTGGRSNNQSWFRERTAQLDFVQPLGQHLIELGAKHIERYNSSEYMFERFLSATGSYQPDAAMSNEYQNRQAINIAYLSVTLKFGKWMIRGGSRLEAFRQEADFISSRTRAEARYQNYLPNLSLARRFGNSTNLNVSYTQRLQRPSLYYLNPFVNNNDPYNLYYGNPDLLPTVSHVFNLQFNTAIKRTYFNLNGYHNFTNGSILSLTTIGADTVAHTTYGNIGNEKSTGGSLGVNFSLGNVFGFGFTGSAGYLQYSTIISNKLVQNEGFNYGINHNGSVTVKGWRLSYNASCISARVMAQGRSIGYFNHSTTLAKSFFKDKKGNISLTVSNPFQPFRVNRTEFDQPLFYQVRHSQLLMRRFSLTFNYRFGKLQAGVKQKKRGIVNDDLKTSE